MAKTGLKLTNCTDVQLAQMACDGEQTAFLVLYDRYKAGITLHVSGFVAQKEEVEDIVLESFQKAFSQIGTYNPDYKFSTWIYRIARNTALDHLQQSGRSTGGMSINSIDDEGASLRDIAAPTGDPEAEVIRSQEYDKLVTIIEGLSDLYRTVARMVLLENYGYQEVADAVDMPLNTVKTRVKRAKEQIIKIMDELEDEQ